VHKVAGKGVPGGTADGDALEATFVAPTGLCIDKDRNLLVADSNANSIRRIQISNGSNRVSTVQTLHWDERQPFFFRRPRGLCAASGGRIIVSDCHRICEMTPVSSDKYTVTVLVGHQEHGLRDGSGTSARLAYPLGITSDPLGNIYVADYHNSAIRKIGPPHPLGMHELKRQRALARAASLGQPLPPPSPLPLMERSSSLTVVVQPSSPSEIRSSVAKPSKVASL